MPVDTNPKHAERIRDLGGPEDPTLRASRKAAKRADDGEAFLPDPYAEGGRHAPLTEDDAESFGEEFIAAATTGEAVAEDARDEVSEEEDGGPFLLLEPAEEVAETEGEESEPSEAAHRPRPTPRRPLP